MSVLRDPTVELASPAETTALAHCIAPRLRAGDTLLLSGPIGAGKTHFARALIKKRLEAEGTDCDVPSPTFTIVQTYDSADTEIWHADLYRLNSAFEIVELGLEEAFGSAICLVEWPDRLGTHAPLNAIALTFFIGEGDRRRLVVEAGLRRWLELTADMPDLPA